MTKLKIPKREAIAYHEAGHALIAVVRQIPFKSVSIKPEGNALGQLLPKSSRRRWTRAAVNNYLAMTMAGHMAVCWRTRNPDWQIFDTGSSGDLDIGMEVCKDSLGLDADAAWSHLQAAARRVSRTFARNRIGWACVEAIAKELLTARTLSDTQVRRIIEDVTDGPLKAAWDGHLSRREIRNLNAQSQREWEVRLTRARHEAAHAYIAVQRRLPFDCITLNQNDDLLLRMRKSMWPIGINEAIAEASEHRVNSYLLCARAGCVTDQWRVELWGRALHSKARERTDMRHAAEIGKLLYRDNAVLSAYLAFVDASLRSLFIKDPHSECAHKIALALADAGTLTATGVRRIIRDVMEEK